jgi:molecular chaperone DnaK (HSP70)
VLARDTRTGQEKVMALQSAVDVDDTAVQRMVEESVQFAFEDLSARQWVETKLRAQETLAAARQGLADCTNELDAACRARVAEAVAAVEAALATEDAQTQTGDPARLKAALAALDDVTRPLADLLMDKAMEALLRQRGLIQ